jgi:hypothetical protein
MLSNGNVICSRWGEAAHDIVGGVDPSLPHLVPNSEGGLPGSTSGLVCSDGDELEHARAPIAIGRQRESLLIRIISSLPGKN